MYVEVKTKFYDMYLYYPFMNGSSCSVVYNTRVDRHIILCCTRQRYSGAISYILLDNASVELYLILY